VGLSDARAFRAKQEMKFRRKPAGVVRSAISEGTLDLEEACLRSLSVANGPLKFTLTSPYMLTRTLLDNHYHDFEALTMAIADSLAEQVRNLPCACLQIDEANVPGSPEGGPIAQRAINRILNAFPGKKPSFLLWKLRRTDHPERGMAAAGGILNGIKADHLVLELAHPPDSEIEALLDIKADLGIGVIDIKVNHVETPEEVACRIEKVVRKTGPGRVKWVHPDCGFWMLKRSIADRKLDALVRGRDTFLGI